MNLLSTGGFQEEYRIIASVMKKQTKYSKKSHKFGIEPCKTMEQALAMDLKNGNIL